MDGKINILLIEDNPADSELVSIFLKGIYLNRSTLARADSLTMGMGLIEESQFDVIILDLTLPDSWGLDTFSKLHAKAPDIPIIVLTGMEDETIGINAVKMGAQDFLLKGKIKGNDLQRSINYSIERHKLIQSLAEKTNALYIEKQKLAEAQKLAHIGSWEWDIMNKRITWSDEFFRIHGLKPGEIELSEDTMISNIHPEDVEYIRSIFNNIIKTATQVTFTYRIIRKDGQVRTLYSGGEVIQNDKGEIVKLIGTGQDVTERVQEEEMEKLALAATKSFNSVIITDEKGNVEWVNEGFTALTGYKLEEIKGTHGESLRRGNEKGVSENISYYQNVVKDKKPVTYESRNYSKSHKEYWTITTLTPVLDKAGDVRRIIAIDSDITIRKQMEEDLLRANKIAEHSLMKGNKALSDLMKVKEQLEESLHIKEQFLANMSHEIRTPMNAIVGFTGLILKTSLTPEQKQYIDAIKTSGENLIVIINDILDFSKIQSGKIPLEQTEFSLGQVVSTLTELMLPKSVEKKIKLSKTIDSKIPDKLIGDPTRLNQILLNLVGNAIKFTQKGEVKINAELVSEIDGQVDIKFSISDTGIGIPQNKLPAIFDSFTQATYDTTRKYGGTGLGLTIVKQLIELHNGTIHVDSIVNKGSTFTFNLTYRKASDQESIKNNKEEEFEHKSTRKLNILLVEDNTLNQLLAKKVLNDWGWDVEIAGDGLAAVEKVKQSSFDLVLMDIQLPEMDGYQATQEIRKSLPHPKSAIPIIAMTAHAISGEEEKCHNAGMDGYISKPFNPQKLYQKILSVTNDHPGELHHGISEETEINNNMNKHTDLSYLKKLANGSDEFITQMLTLFIEQTPDNLTKMEKYVQEKNWESLSKIAHKMKPSIMFVGLKEIEQEVKSVEDYSSQGSHLEEIPKMISHIKSICDEAIIELREEMTQLN